MTSPATIASAAIGQVIGVDTGGTFTDTVVTCRDGRLGVGKALSVPDAPELGVVESLSAAAASLGMSLGELLATTDVLAHGTTVGLNALLTRRGARVGLLTTNGFESTLAIARANKVHGLTADELTVPSRWTKPDLLVPRQMVRGVDERIDAQGTVVRPLCAEQAEAAVAELLDAGVDALAIALLWSVANSSHELALEQIVQRMAPGIHVSVSSRLAPRLGEYERTATVVLDGYVGPLVGSYLGRLEEALRSEGFAGRLLVMRMGGGVQPAATARQMPVTTLHSGPIGGVVAARLLGAEMRHRNIVTADVGGTSFDVGLVIGGEVQFSARPMVERHPLAVPVVDVTSIGIGGGSIAWIDGELGALRVGPQSAGADPGPACYGRGGTQPTLTDAALVLGYLSRLQFDLDRAAAEDAIRRDIADPLGVSVERAADGIVEVACEHMRELVRRTTVQRGFDPSDFVLHAFGGAGAQYVGRFLSESGVREVVVPALAAAFSASGAASCDLQAGVRRDVAPGPLPQRIAAVNDALAALEVDALQQLSGETGATITRTVGLRFYRQTEFIDVPLPGDAVRPDDVDGLIAAFHRRYEEIIGRGTARVETPVELVSVGVQAAVGVPVANRPERSLVPGAPTGSRSVWFGGRWQPADVFDWASLGSGQVLTGPVLVESAHTTVVVHPGQRATVDRDGNIRIEAR